MTDSVEETQHAAISAGDVLAAFPFWPLSVACRAIDAAHREQGRHLPQMGGCPLHPPDDDH